MTAGLGEAIQMHDMLVERPSLEDEAHASGADVGEIIEIHDPEVDVEALLARVRENIKRRRAEGAYAEDLDAVARQVFDEVMAAQTAAASPAVSAAAGSPALAELNARWMVREVPFTSHIPVVGPFIVALRTFWNWMSAKWYVRAILQQQVGFNAAVTRAFNESATGQDSLAKEVARLAASLQEQQSEIALLKAEIERLRDRRPQQLA